MDVGIINFKCAVKPLCLPACWI
uniref:Uncharacterized protein n=1 Tax=Anguilla anguilla TaxID=7936 RepID=A0A0E9QUZ9_ANGAN